MRELGYSYCYAWPGLEYLCFSARLDFESKMLVKEDAPRLLRKELCRSGWSPEETIAISGVTDCYLPA